MAAAITAGIDGEWLRRMAEGDPVRHAWALWDLERFPDRVEFATLREDGDPTAYLLIWRGAPRVAVVHWVGESRDPQLLLAALPPRPLIAVVPEALGPAVVQRRGPAKLSAVLLMRHERGFPVPAARDGVARRLGPADTDALRAFGRAYPDLLTAPYASLDPGRERLFGAFHEGRLAAVARAQVTLPAVWVIGGVYTAPGRRGLGLGFEVTRATVLAALSAGAIPALYVKEENVPAVRIYERLGFRLLERRAWIDATAPAAVPP